MPARLSDILSWIAIALLTTLGIMLGLVFIDFPPFIAKLFILTIALVIVLSLVLDRAWYKTIGFIIGYTPLILFIFTPLGEPMALWVVGVLS